MIELGKLLFFCSHQCNTDAKTIRLKIVEEKDMHTIKVGLYYPRGYLLITNGERCFHNREIWQNPPLPSEQFCMADNETCPSRVS